MKDDSRMDKTEKTIQTYDRCATAFEDKFMGLHLYRDSLHRFSGMIEKGWKVLDLGCGPGNVSRFLIDQIGNIDLTGIDLSREMIRLAERNVPEASFMVKDIRRLNFESATYDAIVAAFCLPFLHDDEAEALIRNMHRVLKPKGYLYLSCMEGTGEGFETASFTAGEELFINYFEETFLTDIFRDCGFCIIDTIRQDYPETDGSVTTDMIFMLQKPTSEGVHP